MSGIRNFGVALLFCLSAFPLIAQDQASAFLYNLDELVLDLMDEGDIPGLSLVIIRGDSEIVRSYGYADLGNSVPVTAQTLFELGSTSKAFTALAIANLERSGHLRVTDNVSKFLPWFKVMFEGARVEITIEHLLHHTSGIPWNTLSKIPALNSDDALEQTVRKLVGQKLDKLPGKEYQYATVNYDILALVAERIMGRPFEEYMKKHIIDSLRLFDTAMGAPVKQEYMAAGYKIGFLSARKYEAPVFRGNNPAGYVISNATDMARWLRFQMGMTDSPLFAAAQLTHERDVNVPLHGMSSYARGWNVSLNGTGEIYHEGLNPNYTSYVAFRSEKKLGVAILANSNSNFTAFIGNKIIRSLAGEEIEKEIQPGDGNDKLFSGIALAIAIYVLIVAVYISTIVVDITKSRRQLEPLTMQMTKRFFGSVMVIVPFLYGIYIVPQAIAGFTWEAIVIWTPHSFTFLIVVLLAAIAISYLAYTIGLFFPEHDEYKRKLPSLLLISVLSGLSNVVVIVMVTSAIEQAIDIEYMIFYYVLTIGVYLLGRRFVQVNLVGITRGMVYNLRMKLIDRIFSTSYDKFEKLDRGKVYTVLNDDINVIGRSISLFVTLLTSVITAVGAFVYLGSIAFWAMLLTIFLVVGISSLYYFTVQSTNPYFEGARDSQNGFMVLINGLMDGFKEISMHKTKRTQYKNDIAASADEFRQKIAEADIRFVNAFLVGESLLVILLGLTAIGMPEIFPTISFSTIMSFVIVLLYLIGPLNSILSAVPSVVGLRIAWNRVNGLLNEIPANMEITTSLHKPVGQVESIEVNGLFFDYRTETEDTETFQVGPIDLRIKRGQVLFIIGGNGSGKTTLAKLLIGLYEKERGSLKINGKEVPSTEIGEYFSSVFSQPYLFKKLYNVDLSNKRGELKKYLELLNLADKVAVRDNKYTTIELSAGQRKRLALLQCYLEDSPIYLFDEWAADQDPEYRNFFYRNLLPQMKKMGKIVIAITHDDHYFDVADKVVKMNRGRLEDYSGTLWADVDVAS